MAKKSVKIADFKSHLSAHLNEVRKGGQIVILDRKTPIAVVTPFVERDNDLELIPGRKRLSDLKNLRFKPVSSEIDSLEVLLEDRRSRDFLS